MPRKSDKAAMILEFVNQFVQENGYAPSVREIGQAVGLRSTASVSYHIQALQEKRRHLLGRGYAFGAHKALHVHVIGRNDDKIKQIKMLFGKPQMTMAGVVGFAAVQTAHAGHIGKLFV